MCASPSTEGRLGHVTCSSQCDGCDPRRPSKGGCLSPVSQENNHNGSPRRKRKQHQLAQLTPPGDPGGYFVTVAKDTTAYQQTHHGPLRTSEWFPQRAKGHSDSSPRPGQGTVFIFQLLDSVPAERLKWKNPAHQTHGAERERASTPQGTSFFHLPQASGGG